MFLPLNIPQDMKKEMQDLKRFLIKEHVPRTRFDKILTSEQLFPLFQHSWASFPPLPRPAPSQHDESEDLQTMMRRMVWMQHVAYMSTFFIEQIEPKFIDPTWWMSVNSTFSPLRIFIKEIYAYLLEHIISSCRFFTDIHCYFWKWLIVTKQTNSSPGMH